jgi:hypothetical protein
LGRAVVDAAAVLGKARGAFARWSYASRTSTRAQLPTRGGQVDASVFLEEWQSVLYGWDYDSYHSAQSLAEAGDMRAVADLCTSIMGSPRAGADLRTRTLAITGAPVSFDKAPRGRRARAAVRAVDADEDWFFMAPEQEQQAFLRWYWILGLALGRLEWWEDNPAAATPEAARDLPKVARIRNGRNTPRLCHWNPRALRYDRMARMWFVRLDDGTEEPIKDGMNGWILWTSSGSRPWLNGLWRGLAPMFLLIGFALQDWRDQSEKFAQGVAVFSGPAGHDEELRVKLVDDWRNAGARGAVYLPEATEMKIFELTANNWQTFEAQIRLAQTSITITTLGCNLPTESQAGVGTGANAQSEVRQDIRSGDARMWETFLHESVARPWAQANFQSADVAPWISINVAPPEDAGKFATAAQAGALALQNFKELQAPIDEVAFLQKLGVPVDESKLKQQTRAKLAAWHITTGVVTLNEGAQSLGYEPKPGRDIYYQPPQNNGARSENAE